MPVRAVLGDAERARLRDRANAAAAIARARLAECLAAIDALDLRLARSGVEPDMESADGLDDLLRQARAVGAEVEGLVGP